MARPKKFNKEEIGEMLAAYAEYIDKTNDPIIAEFLSSNAVAMKYWLSKDDIGQYREFERLNKRLFMKSEAYLTRQINQPTMAIFRLKQPWHGFRDRFETDVTTDGEKITFINTIPRSQKTGGTHKNQPVT